MMTENTKIFCVGMPKTGTMSLHRALSDAGIDSVHYPIKDVIPLLHEGRYTEIPHHGAYCNCGEWHFAALEQAFPGSRFIYTWRPATDWLLSIKRHIERYPIPRPRDASFRNRLEVFSSVTFNEALFRTVFEAHEAAVMRHFANRKGFLRLQVGASTACHDLGSFLKIDLPFTEFPHENLAPCE